MCFVEKIGLQLAPGIQSWSMYTINKSKEFYILKSETFFLVELLISKNQIQCKLIRLARKHKVLKNIQNMSTLTANNIFSEVLAHTISISCVTIDLTTN